MNKIPINLKDKAFSRLLNEVKEGITSGNKELLEKAKKEFADADISLFYNEERGILRVVQNGRHPIDFPIKN